MYSRLHSWADVAAVCDVVVPSGHFAHDLLRVLFWFEPKGHEVHVSKPVAEYFPGPQIPETWMMEDVWSVSDGDQPWISIEQNPAFSYYETVQYKLSTLQQPPML